LCLAAFVVATAQLVHAAPADGAITGAAVLDRITPVPLVLGVIAVVVALFAVMQARLGRAERARRAAEAGAAGLALDRDAIRRDLIALEHTMPEARNAI